MAFQEALYIAPCVNTKESTRPPQRIVNHLRNVVPNPQSRVQFQVAKEHHRKRLAESMLEDLEGRVNWSTNFSTAMPLEGISDHRHGSRLRLQRF